MLNKQEQKIEEDSQQSQDADDRFYVNIHKMELERIKFTLKSYFRARLAKVERHLLYVIEKDQSELLSQAEKVFAFNLYEARKTHFEHSFFKKIPRKLNIMEEEQLEDCYITKPNLDEFVFIRMLTEIA